MKEQRQYERYEAKEGTLVVFGPDYARTGQIVNMGNGGLSFLYKTKKKIRDNPLEVSIVFDENGVAKYGPFKLSAHIVNDMELEGHNSNHPVNTKRCHIQFSNLSYHQKLWLDDCIRNHTTGPVQPVAD